MAAGRVNNNNKYNAPKTFIAQVVEENEHLKLLKSSIKKGEHTASDSQVQLLASKWRKHLELLRVGAKASFWSPHLTSAPGRLDLSTLASSQPMWKKTLIKNQGRQGS